MPQKRKSGYALSDDEALGAFGNQAQSTSTANKPSKRSKKTASTPPIESARSADVADAPVPQSPRTDSNGDQYWEISKARRVTLSDFRGKKMIGIREYYEKDGQMLPGKKGISMTVEQYGVFVTLLPVIEEQLRKSGVLDLPRPNYDGVEGGGGGENGHGDGYRVETGRGRPNHEATSDEED